MPTSEKAALTSPDKKLLAKPETRKGTVSLYAGVSHRQFEFDREQLSNASPYLKRLLAETEGHDGSLGTPEQETYQDLDEFAMALFQHWLHSDGRLAGPYDFHSLHHYLGLYVLARKFEVEALENQGSSITISLLVMSTADLPVMDLVRHYYASENMTAPAFRVEYIYSYTHEPNAMRKFLVSTAAYRSLCEVPKTPGVFLPEPLRALIASNSDVAVDFANAAIALGKNGLQDVRKGAKCI